MDWQCEGGRLPIPRKKPLTDMEKEPLVSDHPFVETVFPYNPNRMFICAISCVLHPVVGRTCFAAVGMA
jgi:hypothetical protein